MSNEIAPMQAFFVHVTASTTGTNFNLNNNHRIHYQTEFLKDNHKDPTQNLLRLKTSTNGYDDYIAVYYKPDATIGFDGNYDMTRLLTYYPEPPQLFAVYGEANDMYMALCLPDEVMQEQVIPLGLQVQAGSDYSISVAEFNDFENVHVCLIDSLENQIINLRNVQEYIFDFAGGRINDRFYLNFEGNHAPVFVNQIENQETYEDAELNFSFAENTFIDNDLGDVLTYQASIVNDVELPEWLNFDSDTRTFSGTPLNDHVGELYLQIVASDLFNETDTVFFTLEVINTNDAPIVSNPIQDQITETNIEYSFVIPENVFSDVDKDDILSYSAVVPDWLDFVASSRTLVGTPSISDVGISIVSITATDIALASVTDNFNLTVFNTISIDDISENDIFVYPNPCDGNFNIAIENNSESPLLSVFNAEGKLMYSEKLLSDINNINLKIAAGSYILEIRTQHQAVYKMIIIR